MSAPVSVSRVEDIEGVRVQNEFIAFIEEFQNEKGERRYKEAVYELRNSERSTVRIDFADLFTHSSTLACAVELQFYRLYPYICRAVKSVAVDVCSDEAEKQRLLKKEIHVSFNNLGHKLRVRELTTDKVGSLVCISGQVVRTHQVHPELCKGAFTCDDCEILIKSVEQQFRYSQPAQCTNPQCVNRSRFRLHLEESTFVDFQKMRIQETQAELPRGSIPRSVDVIVRGELVESAQPGDRCDITGTLIVIPDVAQLSAPGLRAEASSRNRGRERGAEPEGLTGLKALGVRDLNYKMAFLASGITASSPAKMRIQETQAELPRGSIPRSVDVIVRGELVESAQPGDRCDITGTLIVIPDVAQLSAPGLRAEASSRNRGRERGAEPEGLTGLKALGVRDLNYKMAFLASGITASSPAFGSKDFGREDVDHAVLWNMLTKQEQNTLRNMSNDKAIAHNLASSLFPNIYGSDDFRNAARITLRPVPFQLCMAS
ncbi:DNA replication licensing factor mcm-6 [Toxocara canis]|uniref:DNA replication licensing factor MCM6 n=1 Tax=Toxocara canis TaxID=6265 RepID=A0A0B2VZH5_TOXCA|nr:DNA replication licensing factor mcm-6 [Toxocara canis]